MKVFRPGDTGALLVYGSCGMIAAGAILHAVWTVVSPHAIWLRLLASTAAALVWYGSWYLGLLMAMNSRGLVTVSDQRMAVVVLFCLPLAAMAMQSPLWLVRLVWHWRVDRDSSRSDQPSTGPIAIRHMLLVMALIGGSLAGTRAAYTIAEIQGSSSAMQFWLSVGATIGICGGISLIVSLPMVLATLWVRRLPLGLLAIGSYAAGLSCVVVIAITRFSPGMTWWDTFGLGVLAGSFVGGMVVPLLFARLGGYRLHTGRTIGPLRGGPPPIPN